MRFILTPFVFLLVTSVAIGDITIGVQGVPGSGVTTWTFSGSATSVMTTASRSIFIDDNDPTVGQGWVVGTSFYNGTNRNIDFTSTTASFSANNGYLLHFGRR